MGNPAFEDVFPVDNGDFPASHVSFKQCRWISSWFWEKIAPLPFKKRRCGINLEPPHDISRDQLSVDLRRGLYLSHLPNTASVWLEWNLRWFCFHEISSFGRLIFYVILIIRARWKRHVYLVCIDRMFPCWGVFLLGAEAHQLSWSTCFHDIHFCLQMHGNKNPQREQGALHVNGEKNATNNKALAKKQHIG